VTRADGIEERLLSVRARDGLVLTGFSAVPGSAPAACVVWAHGFGVSCDLPQCVAVGRALARGGVAFVAGNLRGHAGGVTGLRDRGGRTELVRIGSWWEVFEESAMDVAAWVDAGRALAAPRLLLVGHSFGAVRSVFYVSETGDDGVDALVLGSPSFGLRRLRDDTARLARELVAAGRGEELLPPGSWPAGFGTDTVSAQTYASWARVAPGLYAAERTRFADVRCPLFVWYGAAGDVGGPDEIELIRGLATGAPRFDSRLLPGVSHGYAEDPEAVASVVAAWADAIAT
jgi:alpha-beta hydrolase superfamily lysophospholipase